MPKWKCLLLTILSKCSIRVISFLTINFLLLNNFVSSMVTLIYLVCKSSWVLYNIPKYWSLMGILNQAWNSIGKYNQHSSEDAFKVWDVIVEFNIFHRWWW